MLDMEPFVNDINQQIPSWILYSIATIVGSAFGTGLNNIFLCLLKSFFVSL